jgi:hypothetical protein
MAVRGGTGVKNEESPWEKEGIVMAGPDLLI